MSKLRVTKEESSLFTTCPKCGKEIEIDLTDHIKRLLQAFLFAIRFADEKEAKG